MPDLPDPDFIPPTNEQKQARVVAGRQSAEAREQSETLVKKEFGQTEAEDSPYWYTYWWIVGWNQYVDSISKG